MTAAFLSVVNSNTQYSAPCDYQPVCILSPSKTQQEKMFTIYKNCIIKSLCSICSYSSANTENQPQHQYFYFS